MAKDNKDTPSFTDKLVPILLLASIGLAFAVGILWQKVSNMEGGSKSIETTTSGNTTTQAPAAATLTMETVQGLLDKDLVKIGNNKDLVLIEVSDPSCPYCSIASGKNPELNKSVAGGRFTLVADGGTYVAPVIEMRKLSESGKATYIYIYSPGHGAGEVGAMAMYCAHEKGKFWDVHDKLSTGEGYDLVNNVVKNDTSKAGEMAQFLAGVIDQTFIKSCIESGKYKDRLITDTTLSRTLGAKGTPFFAINDKTFSGAYSYTDMEPAVNEALGS